MAYNNYRGGAPYSQQHQQARGNMPYYPNAAEPIFKRSGCEMKQTTIDRSTGEVRDVPCLHGWNARKGSFIASPHKDEKKRYCKNGSEVWMVKITGKKGTTYWTIGFWNPKTQKLSMPEISMVASLKGGGQTRGGRYSKGYWGTFVQKSQKNYGRRY